MKRLAALVLLLCATSLSACSFAPSRNRSDEAQLLELHRAGLQAHIDGDVEALLAEQADDFVLLNRGELASPSRQQRREVLGPYLAATDFDYYRDKVPPVVRVARDGSLGWVAAQIEARGTQTSADGGNRTIEFVVAWVELYEKRAGRWTAIGNASSFRNP
jgi:hypothetical protein